jgi:hypothetical protein
LWDASISSAVTKKGPAKALKPKELKKIAMIFFMGAQ